MQQGNPVTGITDMVRYVLIPKFCELTGYTEKAVRRKIDDGVWLHGIHYSKSGDRRIKINLEEYDKWAEGQKVAV